MHARTHVCIYVRTHARAHTHTHLVINFKIELLQSEFFCHFAEIEISLKLSGDGYASYHMTGKRK